MIRKKKLKNRCPYCHRALEALGIAGVVDPYVIDLSKYSNTQDIQSTLKEMTGRRTVPNVFVGGKSIGGGNETVKLQREGKLLKLLQQAGGGDNNNNNSNENQQSTVLLGPPPNGDYGCDLGTEECVTKIVNEYPLVLFSLKRCPECHRILELLSLIGITDPHTIDIGDYRADGKIMEIRYQLLLKAKSQSVPSLFVGGEALGGFYKVDKLHKQGNLVPKLEKVGLLSAQ